MMNYFHVCGTVQRTVDYGNGVAAVIDVPSYQRTDTLVIYPQKPENNSTNHMLQPGQSVTVTGSIMISQGQMILVGAVQPWITQMPQAQQPQMGYGYNNPNPNINPNVNAAAGGQYGQPQPMNQNYQNGGNFSNASQFGSIPAANTGFQNVNANPAVNSQPIQPAMFGGGYASTMYAAQNAEMLGASNNEVMNGMYQSAQSIQLNPQPNQQQPGAAMGYAGASGIMNPNGQPAAQMQNLQQNQMSAGTAENTADTNADDDAEDLEGHLSEQMKALEDTSDLPF